jgi:high-affinity Fe2+/Pb2+ permease
MTDQTPCLGTAGGFLLLIVIIVLLVRRGRKGPVRPELDETRETVA